LNLAIFISLTALLIVVSGFVISLDQRINTLERCEAAVETVFVPAVYTSYNTPKKVVLDKGFE
jgi:hypothetical protein